MRQTARYQAQSHYINGYIMTLTIEDSLTRKKIYTARCDLNNEKNVANILRVLKEKYSISFVKVLSEIIDADDVLKIMENLRKSFTLTNEKKI